MFTFYLTAAAPQVQRAVLRLFSPATQERVGWTWDQAIVQTGGAIAGPMGAFTALPVAGFSAVISNYAASHEVV